jgi:3-phytase
MVLLAGLVATCASGAAGPVAVFLVPADGAEVTVPVLVGVEGAAVRAAVFVLDGSEFARVTSSPFTAWLDPALHPEGEAILEVRAELEGGDAAAQTVTVRIVHAPFDLVVENGGGDGTYAAGTVVEIVADPAAPGSAFDRWTGDTASVADPAAPRTTIAMPAADATVRATYRPEGTPGEATATAETDPVPGTGDAADDPCVWIHPTTPALSTIVACDKSGNSLLVYDLDGNEIQRVSSGKMNNVDLRYNFQIGGSARALVVATNRTDDTLEAYTVNPSTRLLEPAGSIAAGITVYGLCMYRSPATNDTYVFVNSQSGDVEQWKIVDGGAGTVTGTRVRTLDLGRIVEGCVADDELARFYIADEARGIWRYGAEPGDGATAVLVDATGADGHLAADVEGLAIYYGSGGTGYLIASSQGEDAYAVYGRQGDNAYVGTFRIVDGAIDGTSDTDGIDVTNFNLGPAFPEGLFVAQDGSNAGANQNFKLVPWPSVARAFTPSLAIDTGFDPRDVGG